MVAELHLGEICWLQVWSHLIQNQVVAPAQSSIGSSWTLAELARPTKVFEVTSIRLTSMSVPPSESRSDDVDAVEEVLMEESLDSVSNFLINLSLRDFHDCFLCSRVFVLLLSLIPSVEPCVDHSIKPSKGPSLCPFGKPSNVPSLVPTVLPSLDHRGPNPDQPKFGWSVVESMSTEESLPVGSEGWSCEGRMVDTPKVGNDKVGPVMAEMSGKRPRGGATGWKRHWEHCQV